MIIKSVIRGGYRSAAENMKEQGKNEKTRLVELSDPSAKNLDDAFHNMWVVASPTKATKPLHHISINPAIGERLTDKQLMRIVEHCEEAFGYKMFHHQRVIVEHIKDGRQHFHVIWNRVSLVTDKAVWPGKDWVKAKQICRDMEKELGLKTPMPRQKGYNGKTTFPNKRHGKAKSSKGVKRQRGVKHGRSHTSPHSNAGAMTMLNRVGRYKAKRKTSGSTFNRNGSGHNNHGSVFIPAWQHQPLALPKIILFSPPPQSLPPPMPFMPERPKRGWPEAAVWDWKLWGHKDPRHFFALWPELKK